MQKLPRFEEEKHLAEVLRTPSAQESYEKLLLGAAIRKMREKAGMKQAALAKKLKTSQSAVARMEAGKQNFTLRTLIHLAFAFNKKISVKFHGT